MLTSAASRQRRPQARRIRSAGLSRLRNGSILPNKRKPSVWGGFEPDEKAASKAAVRDFDIKKSADLPINWPQSVRSD